VSRVPAAAISPPADWLAALQALLADTSAAVLARLYPEAAPLAFADKGGALTSPPQ